MKPAVLIGLLLLLAVAASAQPSVVPGGVLNAASFAKNSSGQGTAVAPGSLISIFGTGLGTSQADADTVPFSTSLGGVSVTFNNVAAPLRDVIPSANLVNAQLPFEALAAGQATGSVSMVVSVNNVPLAPQVVPLAAQAPGVFSIPPGVGIAVMVNLTDGSVAGPTNANIGLTTHPIPRGTFAFFYATGLGAMSPPVEDGTAGASGITYNAINVPQVMIGGVAAQVLFAGQAPGFPGVYQVNIQIPANAPTGDGISVQMVSADGTITSPPNTAVISVQ
jgi:minor extracellular serine protease Vpr